MSCHTFPQVLSELDDNPLLVQRFFSMVVVSGRNSRTSLPHQALPENGEPFMMSSRGLQQSTRELRMLSPLDCATGRLHWVPDLARTLPAEVRQMRNNLRVNLCASGRVFLVVRWRRRSRKFVELVEVGFGIHVAPNTVARSTIVLNWETTCEVPE